MFSSISLTRTKDSKNIHLVKFFFALAFFILYFYFCALFMGLNCRDMDGYLQRQREYLRECAWNIQNRAKSAKFCSKQRSKTKQKHWFSFRGRRETRNSHYFRTNFFIFSSFSISISVFFFYPKSFLCSFLQIIENFCFISLFFLPSSYRKTNMFLFLVSSC